MSNLLKVAMIETILSLHQRGWSQRRIARELGINRETVARYLRQADAPPKPAKAPTGSAETPDARQNQPMRPSARIRTATRAGRSAIAATGSARRSDGRTAPAGPVAASRGGTLIQAKCDLGLSAQRIYQDLVAEHGFTGSYYSVRRFVRRLEQTHELPFRRIECDPGEEAQVDFGTGAPIVGPDGKRRKTHVFRIVLSHSRKGYSEAVYRQTTDDFLRCLENAFRHFGGVPQRLVLDNLKAAVKKADWFDPELNPKVRSFGEHYGTVFLPTRPYTPRHKGKVERGVDYVQENALRGRTFASLEEQNRFLRDWELTVADTRVHGTTRRQVGNALRRGRARRAAAAARGPFPVVPRGPPRRCTATATSRSSAPTTRCRRSTSPGGSGSAGTRGWCGSSTTGWSRSPCTSSRSRAGSARSRRTSPRRRSAASSEARPGSWPRCAGSGPQSAAGPRRWSRRGASRRSAC